MLSISFISKIYYIFLFAFEDVAFNFFMFLLSLNEVSLFVKYN